MKVTAIKNGSLATNPRTIVHFKASDVLALGDKGLTEANLLRLIELGFADGFDGVDKVDPVADIVVSDDVAPVVIPDAYDFEVITDKAELAEYAMTIYGIELDKRKSLEKMITDLKKEIEGDK